MLSTYLIILHAWYEKIESEYCKSFWAHFLHARTHRPRLMLRTRIHSRATCDCGPQPLFTVLHDSKDSVYCGAMFQSSLIVVVLVVALTQAQSSLVPTPFGVRPSECVLQVPSGSRVDEDIRTNDLIISHPTLGTWRHTPNSICSEQAYAPKPRRPQHLRQKNDCQNKPCTCDRLPCNNWIDNAGWMMDPYNKGPFIGGFSTIMSVPGTPPSGGSQTIFYFPGAENTNGTPRGGQPAPSGRAILQPVLTYGPNTNCLGSKPKSETGWCISSWYCCPKNISVHSPYLGNVKPSDDWLGFFNLTSRNTFETVSRNVKTGEETKLSCPKQGRDFNWADITLEIYAVDSCSALPQGKMTFSNLSIWDENMKPLHPDWVTTHNKPCGGKVTVNAHTVTIEHHDEW